MKNSFRPLYHDVLLATWGERNAKLRISEPACRPASPELQRGEQGVKKESLEN